MMSSEEDCDTFGLFTDDKSMLQSTLALATATTATTSTTTSLTTDFTTKLELNLNLAELNESGELQTSFEQTIIPIQQQNGNDLLYKEEQPEQEEEQQEQEEKQEEQHQEQETLITNDSTNLQTNTNTTTTTTTNKNHHDDIIEIQHNNNDIINNTNTCTIINDEGDDDDEVIFLFGQQQQTQQENCTLNNNTCNSNITTLPSSTFTNTTTISTSTTTSSITTTTTTNLSTSTTTAATSSSTSSSQQVVTDVELNLESSQKGAVNKTTSSVTSCGLKNSKNSTQNTLNKNNSKNSLTKKSKTNNVVSLKSLKIKLPPKNPPPQKSQEQLNSYSLIENNKQVLLNDSSTTTSNKLINNLTLNSASDFNLNNFEDLQQSSQQQNKSDLSVFNSLPNFINQLQQRTSPAQLLTPATTSTVGLTPSTAAALMSSAAAAAAGAAGQALYGALLNSHHQHQQQQLPTSSTSPLTQTNKNYSNANNIHSPNSGSHSSSSPNSSALLTGQFTAALGNLFGANGFGSAKMLNELFGRQMKQAQDATSGLPSSLDNAMLAAAMESATNAELLSAANLVNSLQLTNPQKLLNNNNNNNTITNHTNDHPLLTQTPSPKNRRTSHSSERSMEENNGGRQSRQGELVNSPPRAPSVGNNNSTHAVVSTTTTNANPNSPTLQQQHNDLAHHMLRNILQGKKELMQLDQELRSVINQQQQMKDSQDNTHKLNNNNSSLANNNNNNLSSDTKENSSNVINLIEDSMSGIKIKSEPISQQSTAMELMNGVSQERRKSSDSLHSHQEQDELRSENDHLEQQENDQLDLPTHLDLPAQVTKKEAEEILEDVELMGLNSRSDLESLGSPSNSDMMLLDNSKDDLEEDLDKELSSGLSKKSDLKRARVENIVSSMRSSPSSQQQHLQVNGCKKRKLYQPQQHAMERYVAAAAGLNFGLNLQSMMLTDDGDSDENESPQLQQKRNEKNALKSQLRSMQEQLAEMQQKYVQLCSRMEQESECQEIEDNNSDSMEQEDNNGDLSPSPSINGDSVMQDKPLNDSERASSTSPTLTLKNGKHLSASTTNLSLDNNPNNVLSQMMSKMITGKLHNPLVGHGHMPQSFNGPLPLLQHMPQLQTGEGGLPHPAISNAAAMYLGQQFFFEQEARMAKEVAEQQAAAQQQQQQQQQQQMAQQQQVQEQQEHQRRFEQEQQQRRKEEHQQQQQAQQHLQRQQQLQQLQMEQQQQQQQQQTLQQSARPQLHHNKHHPRHTALKTELSEKFNMLRSSSSSIMRMSGADLEGLADVLKSEITTSLSALVDTIVTRFVHQRRLFSKQSDTVAAAAEQLNKDLLLASQILDRKSPRTKVADRASVNSSNSTQSAQSAQSGVQAVQQAGNNGTLLLNNNLATNSLNNNNINPTTNTNQNPQATMGHLHSSVSANGPNSMLAPGTMPLANVNVNIPQHVNLNANTNPCQSLAPTPTNNVVTPSMAQIAQAQNCQNLIAAPRLNGSQLSFPSPAAAAAAAMGLQMHHAAAAAAMSAAAVAASGQQQQQQQHQQLQALNQHHHANQLNDPNNANNVTLTNLNSNNSSNMNTNNNLSNVVNNLNTNNNSLSTINIPPPHIRPSPTAAAMFQAPKTPQGMNPVAAAALYNSMTGGVPGGPMQNNPFCIPEPRDQQQQQQQAQQQQQQAQQAQQQQLEQNEALSLVVTPKKKRHKVTDTRITPRTVSRILAQDGMVPPSPVGNPANGQQLQSNQNNGPCNNNLSNALNPASLNNNMNNNCNNSMNASNQQQQQQMQQQQQQHQQNNNSNTTPAQSPSPRGQAPTGYHPNAPPPPPPPMMPVSLPTSVAIPNPSLHESQVFSPYSPFFNPHPPHAPPPPHGPHSGPHAPPTAAQMHHMKMSASPPGGLGSLMDSRDGSPPLPPHPSTMLHPALLAAAHHGGSPDYSAHLRAAMDAQDRSSDCNSADMQFDGMQPTISFLKQQMIKNSDSLSSSHSSTLTPMHLRKAKLMFFWVRYPSSSVLKMYFPDIKFNKNNTAQLVKWFSNFREFYYIQMEKYARQAVTEGVKCAEDLHINGESELYRVLNLHYNRNNHIEVPQNFRFVVEQTLREFFRAIQGGKDTEQSWKKSIYKIISRLDDPVPEYFKSPNFLEQLE